MKQLLSKKFLLASIMLVILTVAFGTIFYLNTIKNKEAIAPTATTQNPEAPEITPASFSIEKDETAVITTVEVIPDPEPVTPEPVNNYPDNTYTPQEPMPHPTITNLSVTRVGDNIVCSWDSQHIDYTDGYLMNISNGNRVGTIYHLSGNAQTFPISFNPGSSYVCYVNGYWNGLTTGDLQSNTYADI